MLIAAVIIFMITIHAKSVIKNDHQTKEFMQNGTEMKISELVILVKYAQGAVKFDSFYDYLKFINQSQRKVLLDQIVELIGHFNINDSVRDLAVKQIKLDRSSPVYLVLQEGISDTQLKKIVELSEHELDSSFKLLLTLFSIGYQDGFQKNKDAPDKFWYWDYSNVENTLKFIQLDYNQYVKLDKVLRP